MTQKTPEPVIKPRSSFTYVFKANWKVILLSPVIYSCIIPVFLLDIWSSLYQFLCFRAYNIPRIRRKDYFDYDRKKLSYLNFIEKIHCIYCTYFNGVINYVREIGARTEQRWCPIKHADKKDDIHSRYFKFFEYNEGKDYIKHIDERNKDFSDIEPPRQKKGRPKRL